MAEEFKHKEITDRIIGACYAVHRYLGNGYPEVIYQRALAYELTSFNLKFQRELDRNSYYRNFEEPIGKRCADFIVEGKILLELKAVGKLDDASFSQSLNYLKVFKLEVGLLINFGSTKLEIRRLIMDR